MRSFAFWVLTAAVLIATDRGVSGADEAPEQVAGKTLEEWLKQSKSFDPAVRENSLRAIMQFGKDARKALPTVITLMADPDVGVQSNAIATFRAMANTKDLKGAQSTLLKVLQTGTTVARIHAALALGQVGPDAKAALKTLMDLARAPYSWEMRKAAALALGQIGQSKEGPEATVVRTLTEAFARDKEVCGQVRMQAVISLGMLNAHKTASGAQIIKHPLELAMRYDPDQLVRLWANVLQAQLDSKPETNVLYVANLMQKSSDPLVRANAVQGLAVMGPMAKGHIAGIINALRDKDPAVSGVAASAIGQIKEMLTDRQIADIARMLDDNDGQIKAQAATALAHLGTEKAKRFIPELINLLKDADAALVASAALQQFKDDLTDKHLAGIAALLTEKNADTRAQAARMLALLGPKAKARVPDLITALDDKDTITLATVIMALGTFGKDAEKAVPPLNRLKDDHKDETIRELATKAVDEITGKALMK